LKSLARPRNFKPWCGTNIYEREAKWKAKKKRKKRYKKLWENIIPLVEYRGILEVS
jgi:hypothetical protein